MAVVQGSAIRNYAGRAVNLPELKLMEESGEFQSESNELTMSLFSEYTPEDTPTQTQERFNQLLTVLATIVMFVCSHGGFGLYNLLTLNIVFSPFSELMSGLALNDSPLVIQSLLQILIGYPISEMLIIMPFGIYFQCFAGKGGIKKISPLFYLLEFINHFKGSKSSQVMLYIFFTLAIIALWTIVCGYLFSGSMGWCITFLLVIFYPMVFALFFCVRVFIRCWIQIFHPPTDTTPLIEPKTIQEEADWPFIDRWEKYLNNPETDPFRSLKTKGSAAVINGIFILLYFVFLGLQIYHLMTSFSYMYFGSVLLNIFLFPFYMRFHILKMLTARKAFKSHPKFKPLVSMLLIVNMLIAILFFEKFTSLYLAIPKEEPTFGKSVSPSHIPPTFNMNYSFRYPSICMRTVEGFSVLELLAMQDTAYTERHVSNKLAYFFGLNYSKIVEIKGSYQKGMVNFNHLYHKEHNIHIVDIASYTSFADLLMGYELDTFYVLPKKIFDVIPMMNLVFSNLLNYFIQDFFAPINFFNPKPLLLYYTKGIDSFVTGLHANISDRVIFNGHGLGGGIAKLLAIEHGRISFAAAAPKVSSWYTHYIGSGQSNQSHFLNNLVAFEQMFASFESEGSTDFIPFKGFKHDVESVASILCLISIQCGLASDVQEYCEATIGPVMYNYYKQYATAT